MAKSRLEKAFEAARQADALAAQGIEPLASRDHANKLAWALTPRERVKLQAMLDLARAQLRTG